MSFGIIVPNSLVLPLHGVVRQSCSCAGSNARKVKLNLTVPALFVKVLVYLVVFLLFPRFSMLAAVGRAAIHFGLLISSGLRRFHRPVHVAHHLYWIVVMPFGQDHINNLHEFST